ncbi:MAG: hypothetical protein ABJA82_11495 [Myxococcales bacterium]
MSIGSLRATVPAPSPRTSTNATRPLDPSAGKVRSFVEVLSEGQRPAKTGVHERGAPAVAAPTGGPGGVPPAGGGGERPAMRVLAERALDAEKRVEALIASAGNGRTFSAAELIALQATVFRYSQTVEVISRTADRLVGAIKQTLGTQV